MRFLFKSAQSSVQLRENAAGMQQPQITKRSKKLPVGKLAMALGAFLFLAVIGYATYAFIALRPQNVMITNITDRSATISWKTRVASKGYVAAKEGSYLAPFRFSSIGADKYYDDRDVSAAELSAAKKSSEALKASGSADVNADALTTEVKVEKVGKFYVHHVTINDLQPEKEYSFMVGDGKMFFKAKSLNTNSNKFSTVAELDQLAVPDPAYGKVQELSAVEDVPITDGVVYIKLVDGSSKAESRYVSAPLSEVGAWYLDLSNARNEDGDKVFTTSITYPNESVTEEMIIETGLNGRHTETITPDVDAPAKTIFVNTKGEEAAKTSTLVSSAYAYGNWTVSCNGHSYCENDPGVQAGFDAIYDGQGQSNWEREACASGAGNTTCGGGSSSGGSTPAPQEPPSSGGGDICGSAVKYIGAACDKGAYCVLSEASDRWPNKGGCDGPGNLACLPCGGESSYTCQDPNTGEGCGTTVKEDPNKPTTGGGSTGETSGSITEILGTSCASTSPATAQAAIGNGYKCVGGVWVEGASGGNTGGGTTILIQKGLTCEGASATTISEASLFYHLDCVGGIWSDEIENTGGSGVTDAVEGEACTGSAFSNGLVCYQNKWFKYLKGGEVCNSASSCFCSTNKPNALIAGNATCNSSSTGSSGTIVTEIPLINTNTEICRVGACTCGGSTQKASQIITLDMTCGNGTTQNTGGGSNGIGSAHNNDSPPSSTDASTVEAFCGTNFGPRSTAAWAYCCKNTSHQDLKQACLAQTGGIGDDGATAEIPGDETSQLTSNAADNGSCYSHESNSIRGGYICKYRLEGRIGDNTTFGAYVWYGWQNDLTKDEVCSSSSGYCYCGSNTARGSGYVNNGESCGASVGNYVESTEAITSCREEDANAQTACALKDNSLNKYVTGICDYTETGHVAFCRIYGSQNMSVDNKNTNKIASVNKAYAQETDTITLDVKNGNILLEDAGRYYFELDGKVYSFDSYLEGKDTTLYVDVNSNNIYDDGDTIVTQNVTQLTLTKDTQYQRVSFKKGFNLISFNVIDENTTTASQLLQKLQINNQGMFYSIAKFDSNTSKWTVVGNRNGETFAGEDFQIIPGQGYLVRAAGDVTVNLDGKGIVDTVPVNLTTGWNLIGINGDARSYTAEQVLDAIDAIGDIDADNLSRWNNSKAKYEGLQKEKDDTGIMQVYGFDYPIDKSDGYFVRITSGSGIWVPEK